MRERPILFSAPMIRVILAGTKTQTRRVLKGEPPPGAQRVIRPFTDGRLHWAATDPHDMEQGQLVLGEAPRCPYGQPGDRLWVRETFGDPWHHAQPRYFYRATDAKKIDGHPDFEGWKPSIHMPRQASRIALEITGVRVERLQAISDEDARAEGAEPRQPVTASGIYIPGQYRMGFRDLWESINGADSWAANPWVWVLNFRPVKT